MTTSVNDLVFVPLGSGLRGGLESSVVGARGVVELGVGRVFDRLGVERSGVLSSSVPVGLLESERLLRRVVSAKVRQRGGFDAAVEEVAFGVWHRMLFARFLAENGVLMHPELGVAVSLGECEALANEGLGADKWVVASGFAARMLPGLFPQDDPLSRIGLLPEDLAALEGILEGIPSEVFTSDDGLGWVYQFWQSRAKDVVNASEVKIGARELPAVTQLFTEHYMVRFLLENSLGAWWAARHPDSPLVEAFEYLRFDEDGGPAAGSFDGWPDVVAEVTAMDPCCGSGHFLTALFEMLWRMRVEEEGLDPVVAQDLVLAENLFGLELDPRCTQIAAFNVALTAWKAGGYRTLPELNIACSGIRVAGSRDSWLELAGDDPRLRDGLERLHDVFKDADTLGSLIDPKRTVADDGLMAVGWDEIQPLLTEALTAEKTDDPAAAVFGAQVTGVAKAADLLSRQYTLIATNVPYLSQTRFADELLRFARQGHHGAQPDLATLFVDRFGGLATNGGAYAAVSNLAWLYLHSFRAFRSWFLESQRLRLLATLGAGAFEAISGEMVKVCLTVVSNSRPKLDAVVVGTDPEDLGKAPEAKTARLTGGVLREAAFADLRRNPDMRITVSDLGSGPFLADYAVSSQGICTGDYARFGRRYWEIDLTDGRRWSRQQSTPDDCAIWSGCENVLRWDGGEGELFSFIGERLGRGREGAWIRGVDLIGRPGATVTQAGSLSAGLFAGQLFDNNTVVISASNAGDAAAVATFVRSADFRQAVRRIDTNVRVADKTMLKVPFDVEFWRERAAELFPDGLPEPWSDDPTQWLFLGRPEESADPLQVAFARLLGYSWPDQEPDGLDALADEDGIVCLAPVMGDAPAADRLRALLVEAFDAEDDPVGLVDGLLADADASGKSLGWWLENRFFKQHHQLFHKRPFIWHITDHHPGGFSALVNYHKLDRAGLERLTFTYLGWWISAQEAAVRNGEAGADDRLAAAVVLQDKLKLILEGEPPFDIYVRWKSLAEQPLGWEPDLDDGVRLNIRPFVEAGVLKVKKPAGIKWGKDRGKNPDGSERHNDLHYTRADKQTARNQA